MKVVGIVTLAFALLFAGVHSPASGQSTADGLDWLYLAPDRPILIRLDVRFAGERHAQAFAAAQAAYVERSFRFLDRDGDGRLAEDEAGRAPPPQLQLTGGTAMQDPSEYHFAFNFKALDRNGDGGLSNAEWSGYLVGFSDGPTRLETGPAPSAAGGDPLFAALDRDRDGALAADELNAIDSLLVARDADGDATISPGELADAAAAANGANPVPIAQTTGEQRGTLVSEHSARKIARLARHLDSPPDVILTIDLAAEPETSGLSVTIRDNLEPGLIAILETTPYGCRLAIVDAELRVAITGRAPDLAAARTEFLQQFRNFDADDDGLLSPAESASSFFGGTFSLLDWDGDGLANPVEAERCFAEFLDHYLTVSSRRAAIRTSPRGHGLFDLLDRGRDGRLGLHELAAADAALNAWDENRDGRIAASEVPGSFLLLIGPAQPNLDASAFDPILPREALAILYGNLPRWFRAMDSDADGAVSRNEFLADGRHFAALDANGDGLVAADEARGPQAP